MRGQAWKTPSRLCPCIRGLYYHLADAFWEKTGHNVSLIETMRDEERQHYYYSMGASQTLKSKHLPQPPFNKSLAFDVCPEEYLGLKQWHPKGEYWKTLGELGGRLGLQWGGVIWPSFVDQPHFQLRERQCGNKT